MTARETAAYLMVVAAVCAPWAAFLLASAR